MKYILYKSPPRYRDTSFSRIYKYLKKHNTYEINKLYTLIPLKTFTTTASKIIYEVGDTVRLTKNNCKDVTNVYNKMVNLRKKLIQRNIMSEESRMEAIIYRFLEGTYPTKSEFAFMNKTHNQLKNA